MKVLEGPLEPISRAAKAYPVHLLNYGETGLCLFAAAFLGKNDAIHMARMGMRVTCVDTDAAKLGSMERHYPADWTFIVGDAWDVAENALLLCRDAGGFDSPTPMYDVVSVDTFTGDATDRSIETLDLWCSLAHRLVTATVGKGQAWTAPDGWEGALFDRGGHLADWLVLTRG
jgi:hypothetical protein